MTWLVVGISGGGKHGWIIGRVYHKITTVPKGVAVLIPITGYIIT